MEYLYCACGGAMSLKGSPRDVAAVKQVWSKIHSVDGCRPTTPNASYLARQKAGVY